MLSSLLTPRHLSVQRESLTIEGCSLGDAELGGFAYGPKLNSAPTCVVVGGITAPPFPFGDPQGGKGWWHALCAPDLIDPHKSTILCPAWPGNGSRLAAMNDPTKLPPLSIGGLADLVVEWLSGIDCQGPVTFVGASLGALVGFALATRHPHTVEKLVSVSAGLRPDGWGTATRHLQRELVRDGLKKGDVKTGMVRARQLGMLTYRGRHELDTRFGKLTPGMQVPPIASYLDHHGKRFAETFSAATFLLLSEAIDRCSFGETRAEVRSAAQKVSAEVTVVGVPGDQLFPWSLQEELHRELQAAGGTSSLWKLDSVFGHDAFLADQVKLADVLRAAKCFSSRSQNEPVPAVGEEPPREMRIGLIGCGTVGQGFVQMLSDQRDKLAGRNGVLFSIAKVALRDLKKRRGELVQPIPKTTQAMELVTDPEIDVIVEVAGGFEVENVIRASLSAGKPVVTANKALLAQKLDELGVLAQRTATPLACEAAAAAAIPVLRHLSHRADEIESVMGIVNGTCNYLLTRLEQDKQALKDAIVAAQTMGLAEADPSADVDGFDAAAKLSIFCYRAFGIWAPPTELSVRGIRDIKPTDMSLAVGMGYRIRHIAHAKRVDDGLVAAAEPLLLPSWHLLASVEEEYNAVYMQRTRAGDLSLFGKGAGALPTATALLEDLIEIAEENTMRWPVPKDARVSAPREFSRAHYFRVCADQGFDSESLEDLFKARQFSAQNRSTIDAGENRHLAFLLAPGSDDSVVDLAGEVERMSKVNSVLWMGVGS